MSIDASINKHRKFTVEEDRRLAELVRMNGPKKWRKIAMAMEGRTGRQCRDRYRNYLAPSINKSEWTLDEDHLLIEKVHQYGSCWSKISKFFFGRTSSAIKNRWYFKISPDYTTNLKDRKEKKIAINNEFHQESSNHQNLSIQQNLTFIQPSLNNNMLNQQCMECCATQIKNPYQNYFNPINFNITQNYFNNTLNTNGNCIQCEVKNYSNSEKTIITKIPPVINNASLVKKAKEKPSKVAFGKSDPSDIIEIEKKDGKIDDCFADMFEMWSDVDFVW
ncbi:Myb-like DNA-binding domain containing protein [Tritrichomonas foetus]|uniref:Myb-like DNA-binding domain containing protein n=1 Tax=Tritrichomonas foetus TaxID=1144522 RepID=A0A1J4JR95_9EUKA|nr:Myb-like DNA-binding domain containing protein [Tritrichomonas foetus]|eukprot:OHT01555.1 Myb-like DNA-binding domain containing protein [Tritrichomonas foetus]